MLKIRSRLGLRRRLHKYSWLSWRGHVCCLCLTPNNDRGSCCGHYLPLSKDPAPVAPPVEWTGRHTAADDQGDNDSDYNGSYDHPDNYTSDVYVTAVFVAIAATTSMFTPFGVVVTIGVAKFTRLATLN